MTDHAKEWHAVYQRLDGLRQIVDAAYVDMTDRMMTEDLKFFGDDRAEALIAAITEYVCECNPELKPKG